MKSLCFNLETNKKGFLHFVIDGKRKEKGRREKREEERGGERRGAEERRGKEALQGLKSQKADRKAFILIYNLDILNHLIKVNYVIYEIEFKSITLFMEIEFLMFIV